uniref:Ig-like domain-containing protein n=1 Tax=Acanthochromis polyacanthus TaxID=80966 RepID=A0A3Q1EZ25_9TELE
MEGRSAVWLLAALLLLEALISAEAQNTLKYLEVGGKLVLKPKPVSEPIRSIIWKFNFGVVGEWHKDTLPLDYSEVFKDRAKVDTTTGELEISNMMKTDSGLYTVEINDGIQDGGYDVGVIKQVPKPTAFMRPPTCTQSSERCFLTCDGDITEAGPVTFYFKKGDGGWEEGEQAITIMNDKDTKAVETFSCRMKNPVGQKDSEPVKNPFYVKSNPGLIVGIVLGVLAVVGVIGGVIVGLFLKKQRSGNGTVTTPAASTIENGDKPEERPLKDMSPEGIPDSKEDV